MTEINTARLAALDELTRAGLTFGSHASSQPAAMSKLDNWHWYIDTEGMAWAVIDKKGKSTNTLSEAVLTELGLNAH